MNYVLDYSDSMDVDDVVDLLASKEQHGEETPSTENYFRINLLLLATYPWFSPLPVISSKLVENIGDYPERRYASVGHSLDGTIASVY